MDMGAQRIHLSRREILALAGPAGLTEQFASRLAKHGEKTYPPSWILWQALGVDVTRHLDLFPGDNGISLDLNHELDTSTPYFNAFDMVTDFGNNEHAFNVGEAYRTMHRLAKPGGLLWIEQSFSGCGNGLYSFQPEYFEALALANSYSFVSTHLIACNKEYCFSLPYDFRVLDCLNGETNIGYSIVLRKTSDADFVWPGENPYNLRGSFPFTSIYFGSRPPLERMTYQISESDIAQMVTTMSLVALIGTVKASLLGIFRKLIKFRRIKAYLGYRRFVREREGC